MIEIRCHAPRKHPRFEGDHCGGYVAEIPAWFGPVVVARLSHSRERTRPDTLTTACTRCGAVIEIALRALAVRDLAA